MGLRRPEDVAQLRGLSIKQVLGIDLQEAAAKQREAQEAPADPPADEAPVAEPVAVAAESEEPAPEAEGPSDTGREAEDVDG